MGGWVEKFADVAYYSLVPPSRGQANEGHCNWILKHTFLNDEPFVSLIFLPRTFDANLHLLLLTQRRSAHDLLELYHILILWL